MATKKSLLRSRNTAFLVSVVLFALTFAGSFIFLVNNSNQAKRRYDKLLAVDSAGGDVEAALADLRSYIYSHMNTSLGNPTGVYPPIQLKGTYDRLVAAEEARNRAANQGLYDEATAQCESRFGAGQIQARAECVSEYVAARGVHPKTIPDGLYKFNFVSPKWSPDLAGFFILAAGVTGLNLLFQVILEFRLRAHLRRVS